MAIAVRSVSVPPADEPDPTGPSGQATGDLIFYVAMTDGGSTFEWTPPSDGLTWGQVWSVTNSSIGSHIEAWAAVITGSPPATYPFEVEVNGSPETCTCLIYAISGGAAVATGAGAATGNTGSAATTTWNGLTVPSSGSILIAGIANGWPNFPDPIAHGSPSPGSWTTTSSDLAPILVAHHRTGVSAGATGNFTASIGEGAEWEVGLACLVDTGAGATAAPPSLGSSQRNVRQNPVYRMSPSEPRAPIGFKRRGRIYVPARLAA